MQHVSSYAIKLLLEKFKVCPNNVHTWLNLHQRLRDKTHKDTQIRKQERLVIEEAAKGTAAILPDPAEDGMGKGYSQNSPERILLAP